MTDTDQMAARIAALEEVVALLVATQHSLNPDPSAAPDRLGRWIDEEAPEATKQAADPLLQEALRRLFNRANELQRLLPARLIDS